MAVLGHHTSDSDAVPSQPLIQNGGRIVDYGQRNSLKTINVDGEHFIRLGGKSCVFKFIRLSVDVASDHTAAKEMVYEYKLCTK